MRASWVSRTNEWNLNQKSSLHYGGETVEIASRPRRGGTSQSSPRPDSPRPRPSSLTSIAVSMAATLVASMSRGPMTLLLRPNVNNHHRKCFLFLMHATVSTRVLFFVWFLIKYNNLLEDNIHVTNFCRQYLHMALIIAGVWFNCAL